MKKRKVNTPEDLRKYFLSPDLVWDEELMNWIIEDLNFFCEALPELDKMITKGLNDFSEANPYLFRTMIINYRDDFLNKIKEFDLFTGKLKIDKIKGLREVYLTCINKEFDDYLNRIVRENDEYFKEYVGILDKMIEEETILLESIKSQVFDTKSATTKDILQQFIEHGKSKEAVNILKQLNKDKPDIINQCVLILRRLNNNTVSYHKRTILKEEFSVELTRINDTILHMIDDLV